MKPNVKQMNELLEPSAYKRQLEIVSKANLYPVIIPIALKQQDQLYYCSKCGKPFAGKYKAIMLFEAKAKFLCCASCGEGYPSAYQVLNQRIFEKYPDKVSQRYLDIQKWNDQLKLRYGIEKIIDCVIGEDHRYLDIEFMNRKDAANEYGFKKREFPCYSTGVGVEDCVWEIRDKKCSVMLKDKDYEQEISMDELFDYFYEWFVNPLKNK